MADNPVQDDRRNNLDAIVAMGIYPYGGRFDDAISTKTIASTYDALEGKRVTIAGRVMAFRDHGKTKFLDVQDANGTIQAYLRQKDIGDDAFALLCKLDLGDIIGVSGSLGKTKMGEITVFCDSLKLLCKSLRPLPEKWHGLKDVETRFRRRYLDLISNREAMDIFVKRSLIIRRFRKCLEDRGFLEVATPTMQPIPGGAAAKPFITHHNALDMELYMRIAPELYLKRLLVGGMERVFEIAKCFRNEGISTRHNPEFDMCEIYQAYGDCEAMMELCEHIVSSICTDVLGTFKVQFGDLELDFTPPWRRASFIDLVRDAAGLDPWDEKAVREALKKYNIEEPTPTHGYALQALYEHLVEPNLIQPTFVIDHPAELTPLCRPKLSDPRLAERFELFVARIEMANAYTELNDPDVQRKNFEQQLLHSGEETAGKIDEDFLLALEHGMPPAGGMGIGIDRLVMLLTGNTSIREVILFPLLRPRES